MADDISDQATEAWLLTKFRFQVEWDNEKAFFQEVSGLDVEVQIIEYRQDDNPLFSTRKIPRMQKMGNVIMKCGVFKSDNKFRNWFNEIKMNTIQRKTVTIKLFDEVGTPTKIWTLANAWPVKIDTGLKSDANEVAVERIEFVHEGVTIVKDS